MQIDITYLQNTVSSLPTGFVADVNYVVNYFDSLFTNNVTLNIQVGLSKFGIGYPWRESRRANTSMKAIVP